MALPVRIVGKACQLAAAHLSDKAPAADMEAVETSPGLIDVAAVAANFRAAPRQCPSRQLGSVRQSARQVRNRTTTKRHIMRLEDCFLFLSADDIRIRGTGVGIEHILYDYLYRNEHPEAVAARYPTVRLEQVYATITYFWFNQAEVEPYVARWLQREMERAELEKAVASSSIVSATPVVCVQAA
jgi:uncharacterized protein (DUF433 family)